MAQAGDIVDVKAGLRDITECCICNETYKVPKILPCIHAFCQKCLENFGSSRGKGPGDSMPCPICRREFVIPADGFGALPKHFFMNRLLDMMKTLSPAAAQCEACAGEDLEDGTEVPNAVMYCVDCNQKICAECSRHHQRMRITRTHRQVQLGSDEFKAVNLERAVPSSVCDKHSNESLKVYCADCKAVSCALCFIETHRNHRGSHIDTVVDDFRQEIQTIVDKVGTFSENVRTKLGQMNEQNTKTLEQIGFLQSEVERTKHELTKLVDRHANELNGKLNLIKQERIKEFKTEKDDFETHIAILESFQKYCSEMLAKGSSGDVCRAVNDLGIRGVELQELYESMMQRQMSPFHVSFQGCNLKEFTEEGRNIVGMLEGNEKKQGQSNSEEKKEYKGEPVVVGSFKAREGKDDSKKIWGLAVLDDELFTVTDECAEVEVFDLDHFSVKRHFILGSNTGLQIDLQDIAACNLNKCLYVMNWVNINKPKEILRIDVNGKVTKKWSTGSEFGRLSVSKEGNITVTVIWKNKLKEYNRDGSLLRDIRLSSVIHPRHAIRLNEDLFVVGFGDDDEDSLHGICIVDHQGNSIKTFGGSKGSSTNQVNCPLALVVDDDGLIIAADEKNCRLLLFGPNLEFKKVIATEKCGLRDPWRIYLNSSTGRMFVADNAIKNNDQCRVLMLDLK